MTIDDFDIIHASGQFTMTSEDPLSPAQWAEFTDDEMLSFFWPYHMLPTVGPIALKLVYLHTRAVSVVPGPKGLTATAHFEQFIGSFRSQGHLTLDKLSMESIKKIIRGEGWARFFCVDTEEEVINHASNNYVWNGFSVDVSDLKVTEIRLDKTLPPECVPDWLKNGWDPFDEGSSNFG